MSDIPIVLIVIRGELAKESGPWVLPKYKRKFDVPKPVYEAEGKFRIYWFKDVADSENLTYHATDLHYFSVMESLKEGMISVVERDNGKPICGTDLPKGAEFGILAYDFPNVAVRIDGLFIEERKTLEVGDEYERYEVTIKKMNLKTGDISVVEKYEDVLD